MVLSPSEIRALLGGFIKGLASSAKPGIHESQKLAELKNSLTCLAVVGMGILSIVSFRVSESHWLFFL